MRKIVTVIMILNLCAIIFATEEIKYFSSPGWVPFLMKDSKGNFYGFTVELMDEIALKLEARAVLQDVPWKRGFKMMDTGEIDICSSLYVNEERKTKYIFTESIIKNETRIFVKKERQFDFESFKDLKGKSIGKMLGASFGTEFDNFAKANINIVENPIGKEALFKMLLINRIDGVLMDYSDGMSYIKKNSIKNIVVLDKPVNSVEVFMAISKKSSVKDKLFEINEIIKELKKSGVIEKMAEKYY